MKGKNKMRNLKTNVIAVVALLLVAVFCFASCGKNEGEKVETYNENGETVIAAEGLWKTATHRKNVTVGEGSKEAKIAVEINGQSITITVKTDKAKLGDALYAEGLINDASFFDTLNGIKADWDKDQAYWGFYKGEEYMTVGVNDTAINTGDSYRFVYTK